MKYTLCSVNCLSESSNYEAVIANSNWKIHSNDKDRLLFNLIDAYNNGDFTEDDLLYLCDNTSKEIIKRPNILN